MQYFSPIYPFFHALFSNLIDIEQKKILQQKNPINLSLFSVTFITCKNAMQILRSRSQIVYFCEKKSRQNLIDSQRGKRRNCQRKYTLCCNERNFHVEHATKKESVPHFPFQKKSQLYLELASHNLGCNIKL